MLDRCVNSQVLRVAATNLHMMNGVNLATAIHRLARTCQGAPASVDQVGVDDIRGTLIGVLMTRGSDLGISESNIGVPLFRKLPGDPGSGVQAYAGNGRVERSAGAPTSRLQHAGELLHHHHLVLRCAPLFCALFAGSTCKSRWQAGWS